MATKTKPTKRLHIDSSDSESEKNNNFPRFIILESLENKQLTKISPFTTQKIISTNFEPKTVKSLRDGKLLIEVTRENHANFLLKMKTFNNIKIKAYPHETLNHSKGVVRSPELSLCSIEEIKSELKNQGVTDARRIIIKKEGRTVETNIYILTFNSPNIPNEVRIGYQKLNIETYIPNPLRCHNCQKFGHHKDKCTRSPVCERCGENDSHTNCQNDPKCANCKQNHHASSKNCNIWKKEKDINQIKYTKNITFPEARKLIEKTNYADTTRKNIPNTKQPHCHTCETNSPNIKLEDISLLIYEMKNLLQEIKTMLNKTNPKYEPKPQNDKDTTKPKSQKNLQNPTNTEEKGTKEPPELSQNTPHKKDENKIPPDKVNSGHNSRKDRSRSTSRSQSTSRFECLTREGEKDPKKKEKSPTRSRPTSKVGKDNSKNTSQSRTKISHPVESINTKSEEMETDEIKHILKPPDHKMETEDRIPPDTQNDRTK